MKHFVTFAVAALVFYVVGVKYPGLYNKVVG